MIRNIERPSAFVIAPSNHGMLILNRFDHAINNGQEFGVGYQILEKQSFDQQEVDDILRLLDLRRIVHGEGVIALDCGANIGVHTIEMARHMYGWGKIYSFEAQERIFLALAGNITINNCFNANPMWAAISDNNGEIDIGVPNYFINSSFGSYELIQR